MAISEPYVDSGTTIGTTEYSLPGDSTSLQSITDDGVYVALLDFTAMALGDEYTIKLKEKVYGADTQITIGQWWLAGPQTEPHTLDMGILLHGWDLTVTKLAGTDRSIAWSIRKVS